MRTETIEIVDRGRGPQLSNSRITVLDLVRYFHKANAYEEITRWIPTLTHEEIAAVQRYYLDHKEEFDERNTRAQERREEQIRLQRLRFPELSGTKEEQIARLRHIWKNVNRRRTVPGILADNNVIGQVAYLVRLMQTDGWGDFWNGLGLVLVRFDDVGLSAESTDLKSGNVVRPTN